MIHVWSDSGRKKDRLSGVWGGGTARAEEVKKAMINMRSGRKLTGMISL